MEEKINGYVAPNLTGFTVKLDVLEERLTSVETNTNTEVVALKTNITTEMSAVKELVSAAQDDARTIRTDLRKDINEVQDQVAGVDRRARGLDLEVRGILRQIESDMRTLIDHAADRFDGKRTAIESDATRRAEAIDTKLKELEERLRTMLVRALDNPLAGQ
jgi:predicted phage-related endonuclease